MHASEGMGRLNNEIVPDPAIGKETILYLSGVLLAVDAGVENWRRMSDHQIF
jgi:hypothetical protein